MWNQLIDMSVSPTELIVRGTIIFLAILFLLRLAGKRQLGQMSPTEFVVILLISNAVQNSMNAGDNSLVGGLILSVTLIFLSWGLSELNFHSKLFSRFFEGTPTLLVHNGEVVKKNLYRERLTTEELVTLLRKQGVHHFSEIHTAVLEADGVLSIIKKSEVSR
ncbi:MAG: DUF421 domain-containing protein [Deltaproteobacteria bacterium]|nr:DUF421 domain-containing protein [Deltaproteobacteria bacterium]